MFFDHLERDVDLLELDLGCPLAGRIERAVDRPELPADPTRPQPLDVGVEWGGASQIVRIRLDIVRRDLASADRPGQIVVSIDERRGREYPQRFGHMGILLGKQGSGQK